MGMPITFEWRKAIQASALDATTKLVLYNLSIHMAADGTRCWPSTVRQAKDTGLSQRTVCTHLAKAVETGFLKKKLRGNRGQAWKSHEYTPTFPRATEIVSAPLEKGTEARSAPINDQATEPNVPEELKEVQPNNTNNNPFNNSGSIGHAASLVVRGIEKRHAFSGKPFNGEVIQFDEESFNLLFQKYSLDGNEGRFRRMLINRDQWYSTQPWRIKQNWRGQTCAWLSKRAVG